LAKNTEPKPPLPRERRISYFPTFCPCRNMSRILELGDRAHGGHEASGALLIDLSGVKLV
jgi:hypothetical protein